MSMEDAARHADQAPAGDVSNATQTRAGKNIVLLSDGTGNSAASPFKTNIWRIYQALDLAPPAPGSSRPVQVAFYDDGVGTETFKPLRALGGAFGLGVWTNVRDLYTHLCRNYQDDDRIYAFGFSRGAFTIRLLVGLIGKCGIVRPRLDTEQQLREGVEQAYGAYRRDFLIRASRRRNMIYPSLWAPPVYQQGDQRKRIKLPEDQFHQVFPKVSLLGVFDTVDAYGMPVEELKEAIDQWVWPMSVADHDPSRQVERARQALSLDDDRPTFRPVIWNEVLTRRGEEPEVLDETRMQQVWFAGVHSNIGGGYPDDALSYVPLHWMMSEAEAAGLHFRQGAIDDVARRSDPHGQLYDARAGIGGYYRYKPRDVRELCSDHRNLRLAHKDKAPDVSVPIVRVHKQAFERIAREQVPYAPLSLTTDFQVFDPTKPTARDTTEKPRSDQLDLAWLDVWWRRAAFFSTVFLTVALIVVPIARAIQIHLSLAAWVVWAVEKLEQALAFLLGWLSFLPPLVRGLLGLLALLPIPLVSSVPGQWTAYPLTALFFSVILGLLFFYVSPRLQRRIHERAEWAWAAQKRLDGETAPKPDWRHSFARRAGSFTRWGAKAWRAALISAGGFVLALVIQPVIILWRTIVLHRCRPAPWEEGSSQSWLRWRWRRWLLPIVIALVWLCLALIPFSPVIVHVLSASGAICNDSAASWTFKPKRPCHRIPLDAVAGQTYNVRLTITKPFRDGGDEYPLTDPNGFGWSKMGLMQRIAAPLRRHMFENYYRTIVRVGTYGRDEQPLTFVRSDAKPDEYSARFTARSSGPVFLYVNDAVIFHPSLSGFIYANNKGAAEVTITRQP